MLVKYFEGNVKPEFNVKSELFDKALETVKEVKKHFIDIREEKPVPSKYYLSTQYVNTLVAHKERHAAKGNGFGYEIIDDNGVANAIVVGGMGRERNLVIDKRQTD